MPGDAEEEADLDLVGTGRSRWQQGAGQGDETDEQARQAAANASCMHAYSCDNGPFHR
jgi:hypothetical protein